ncbi:hypothetical protein [Saccharothrix syringae]|uniref:Uncharacterized protein n=1 Tax=Saccharothrix syringae TaxID=103733 RepID=A0A5Q0HFS6_SACSY|nr:hypothetical protein [Saccharothrix syringae]QFZ24885.1 hypothetical protein EKG83_44540 [Saccharothrix syringae]
MLYLLAVVGALTIAVLLWRSFGPDRVETAPSRRFVAPDDNPDFLRKLGEQRAKKPEDEE